MGLGTWKRAWGGRREEGREKGSKQFVRLLTDPSITFQFSTLIALYHTTLSYSLGEIFFPEID